MAYTLKKADDDDDDSLRMQVSFEELEIPGLASYLPIQRKG
jgi:hypothetical protein